MPRRRPSARGRPTAAVRNVYGAGPFHLVVMLVGFALAAYTLVVLGPARLWNPGVWWQSILIWFAGAVALHDLVLFPVYAFGDRVIARARYAGGRFPQPVNYVRVTFLAIALLFVMYFPGIIRQGAGTYVAATGQTQAPFLSRWLILSAIIAGLSACVYVIHGVVATARGRRVRPRRRPARKKKANDGKRTRDAKLRG